MKSKTPGKRRPTIGNDPLEVYVPSVRDTGRPEEEKRPSKQETRPTLHVRARAAAKVRATFHISAELLEEARNAVVYLAGPPTRLTLADLAESALKREIERLKKAHNTGKEFPARNGELKGGRPIR